MTTRPPTLLPLLIATALACSVSFAVATSACTRVDDSELDADTAWDARLDSAGDSALDTAPLDTAKDAKVDTAGELPAPAKELCGNILDDDGDGLIDEASCYPGPNLRPDQQWTDLGVVPLAAVPGSAPVRTFSAALKNQGISAFARDLTATKAYVWGESLLTPSGLQVLTPGAWATSGNRGYVGLGYATLQIGMAPQISVVAGPWTLGFTRSSNLPTAYKGTPQAGSLHLGVLSRPDLPVNQAGKLDLNVYCVGGAPMPCAQLANHVQWKLILAKINAVWKLSGVELGTVEMIDLDGEMGSKFRYLDNVFAGDSSNELNQVYQAVGKLRPQSTAATLVLVSAIQDNGLPVAAGLSQLGGLTGFPDLRVGGMAVAFQEEQWKLALSQPAVSSYSADVWGLVIAHEIGHLLGLWHTDEGDASLHDPIEDTPQCTASGGVLTPDVCPVQSKYLMFWSPKGATLTAGQSKVARLNPMLR